MASGIWVAAAAMTGLVLAACGGHNAARPAASPSTAVAVIASPSPTPGKDACSVFTAAEVQAVMGQPVEAGRLSVSGGAQRCIWFVTGRSANFQVGIARGPGGYARQVYSVVGIPEAKAIPGLGDQAKAGLSSKCCIQGFIAVVRGPTELDITITGASADPTEETLRELAQKALARL